MSQYQEKATVARMEQFSDTHYRVTLDSPLIAASAKPGQFVMVRTGSGMDPFLRRPFSVHQTSSSGRLQLYFKVVGRGTALLAKVKRGEELSLLGPLGRGYQIATKRPALLIGGGLGIAPLLFLARENCRLKKSCHDDVIVLGARNKKELAPLVEDFRQFGGQLFTVTDDGSLGHHGLVTEVLEMIEVPKSSMVYTCGPEPMLANVGRWCRMRGLPCQVSVESVMACGMGACLGCSRVAKDGSYTHVCLNGPVYDAEDLVWNI